MTKHYHLCVCGTFQCVINILPLPDGLGRVRCERVYEAICESCFESCLSGQTVEEQRATLESMAKIEVDPLLQWRAARRLKTLNGG